MESAMANTSRNRLRVIRHRRIRRHLKGTPERPRLSVFRSNRHLFAQVIDDTGGKTLLALSTLNPELKGKLTGKPVDIARQLGGELGKRALEAGIKSVVFDRGGHEYHGAVKAFADSAREAGLEF